MFRYFNRRARKFGETLRVVGKISMRIPVEAITLKIRCVFDEKITHASKQNTAYDSGKPQSRAHRNREAACNNWKVLIDAVPRKYNGYFMALARECARKGLNDIRKAARL